MKCIWTALVLGICGLSMYAAEPQRLQLQGQVICIPEEMNKLYKTDLPTGHAHLYGLRATNGTIYTLLRTKFSEAIYLDERLRQKQLLIAGMLLPQTQALEVKSIKSVRDGVVHDLFYYCEICDIEAVSPEPCSCCQAPVVLTEKPLRSK